MTCSLVLVSHLLCPYVQRAAIALTEKDVSFERITIDLANKPDWFRAVSPLGKVPLLKTGETYLFESGPILEYLEDIASPALHPADPIQRAQHRAYVEFGSQVLNGIGALYNAADEAGFAKAAANLRTKFTHLDQAIDPNGPYFSGRRFSLVDAAFGPVFRYFDVFDTFAKLHILENLDAVGRWRSALARRPSVRDAVASDYPIALRAFIRNRGSWLSGLLVSNEAAA